MEQPTLPRSIREQTYMSEGQMDWFRGLMHRRLEAIEVALHEIKTEVDSTSDVGDDADRADTEVTVSNLRGYAQRLTVERSELQAAIGRINTGEYGYCEDTGEEIGLERLLAIPHTRLSVASKERAERRGSQYLAAAAVAFG